MTHAITTFRITTAALVGPWTVLLYLAVLVASIPAWPFEWHLGLHVLGAVMLIGNAAVMGVWLTVAGLLGGDDAKRRAIRAVNVGDVVFTVPGSVLLLLNGVAMTAQRYGGLAAVADTPWIGAGLVLLVLTGAVWAVRLVPAQLRLHALARAEGELDRASFRSELGDWSRWGVVATVLPIVAVVLMTTKPAL